MLLYLTGRECVDSGRGLRCGALLELHNVHAMKLTSSLEVCFVPSAFLYFSKMNFSLHQDSIAVL